MTKVPASELRLLIVEDEALIAMELEDLLQELGHRVVGVCGSVARALACVDEHGQEMDGVVLDANLGGSTALPVAERLRERGIPFLVASGYEGEQLHRLGFDALSIRKPYRKEEISRALAGLAEHVPPLLAQGGPTG